RAQQELGDERRLDLALIPAADAWVPVVGAPRIGAGHDDRPRDRDDVELTTIDDHAIGVAWTREPGPERRQHSGRALHRRRQPLAADVTSAAAERTAVIDEAEQ